jgi:hypothetical protein
VVLLLASDILVRDLIVNPWNTAETGEAIHRALTMPKDEKRENHNKLRETRSVLGSDLLGKCVCIRGELTPSALPCTGTRSSTGR